MRPIISSIEAEYRRYKLLAEAAIHQLDEARLVENAGGAGNSIATLVWHLSGNLKSRFTDFLTTDGEKPWRNRDAEFLPRRLTKSEILQKWEEGWRVLFTTLQDLSDDDLSRSVTIRGSALSVPEALHRSLAHASYHVGQIVFMAKAMCGADWQYLSIPPGRSSEYDQNPAREKAPRPTEEKR
jgi:uncharacterized damage-inducible protein DinB